VTNNNPVNQHTLEWRQFYMCLIGISWIIGISWLALSLAAGLAAPIRFRR